MIGGGRRGEGGGGKDVSDAPAVHLTVSPASATAGQPTPTHFKGTVSRDEYAV